MSEEGQHDDIQIGDTENYRSEKDNVYSHQALIMQCKRRIIELGQHELIEGYSETITDPRKGITKVIYREDTKRAFINAVEIVMAVMECDYDGDAKTNINKLIKSVDINHNGLITSQFNFWVNLSPKEKYGLKGYNRMYLHKELPFYQDFVNFEIKVHIKIFSELNKLAKRLDWYGIEMFEA